MTTSDKGKRGELAAAAFLRKKGFRILCANYHCRFGEIDIIAADTYYISFVEVKTRGAGSLFEPREAVDYRKRERIIRTAEIYLMNTPGTQKLQPRFDVVEIILKKTPDFKVDEIRYIQDAFSAENA